MVSDHDLVAYLDEALPAGEMARIEDLLRQDARMLDRVSQINSRRDSGIHTLGEIWRRQGLMCPSREQLGGHLLGTLSEEESDYILFRVEVLGCRLTQANLEDLQQQQAQVEEEVQTRRRRYFQSSAGLLKRK